MEQPPSSTSEDLEKILAPKLPTEKDREASLDLEHFGVALDVAEDVPAIEEAIQGLHPGEKILINGVHRMQDGEFEVRFDHNGVQETKVVKFQE